MRQLLGLLAILSCSFWFSCKSHCLYNAIPYIRLMNFDTTDLKAVILTTFTPNTGFKDTILRQIWSTRPRIKIDDTNLFDPLGNVEQKTMELYFATDAIVEVPSIGKVYHIRNVTQNKDKLLDANCTNSWSYYLNDTLHTMPVQAEEKLNGFIDLYK